ncbi:hypothetical protein [Stenotrophomonas maltophilia]|uniref:hypothetical protein n=1 Tax=Stenotrophomonas maltophilia TaxID=40324 RepID=UPI003BF8AE74
MALKHGWVRNPLSVIAIFAGVAELSGAAVLPRLTGEVQVVFMFFVMFFPCALVGLFFYVLWFKAKVLYAPGDYKNDETFERLHGPRVYSANGENATPTPQNSNSEPISPPPAYANAEGSTGSENEAPNGDSASQVRESTAPYSPPNSATEGSEGEKTKEVNSYPGVLKTTSEQESIDKFIAEQRALLELHDRYGGTITSPAIVSTAGGPTFMIDGFINTGSRQYFVEVVHLTRPTSTDRFRGVGRRLARAWQSLPVERQKMTTCVICITAKDNSLLGSTGDRVRSYMARNFPDVNVQIESINTDLLGRA